MVLSKDCEGDSFATNVNIHIWASIEADLSQTRWWTTQLVYQLLPVAVPARELSTAFSYYRPNNTMMGSRDALSKYLLMLTPFVVKNCFGWPFPFLNLLAAGWNIVQCFRHTGGHGRGVLRAPALLGPGKGAQGIWGTNLHLAKCAGILSPN